MISVVVPVFRNAATLRELTARLLGTLALAEVEILLVLDAPPDDSAHVAAELAAADARIKPIALPRNVGQHRAILAGLAVARGEIAVVLDADLQDAPESIPQLLDFLQTHPEQAMVCATRAGRHALGARRLTSWGFKTTLRILAGGRIPKNAGLFLALRRPLYQRLSALQNRWVHLLALLALTGVELPAIAVERHPAATTGYTGAMRLRAADNAFRTLFGYPAPAERGPAATMTPEARALLEPGRRLTHQVAAAVALFLLRLFLAVCAGWHTSDEAWILQIIQRTSHGDLLYRDVFFGAPPVSIYLGRAACFVFGTHVLTVKALCAAVDTSVFVATWRFLKAQNHAVSPWVLGLCMALFPLPLLTSLYSSLATLFLLLTALAFFQWRRRPSLTAAFRMGLALGLCLASKQNIGIYGLLAVSVCLLAAAVPGALRLRHGVVLWCTALLVLLLTLLPTLLQGAGSDFLAFALADKSQYLRLARINFFQGFNFLARTDGLSQYQPLTLYIAHLLFPVALLALAGFAWTLTRPERRRLLPALPFLLVLAAGVLPRADADHLAQAAPAIFIALALSAAMLPVFLRKILAALAIALPVLALVALLSVAASMLASPNFTFSRLPHLRGILLSHAQSDHLTKLADAARRQPQPVFILSTEASALYLLSGCHDPTPYDYPLVNEFLPGAQEKIAAEIRAGRIAAVLRNATYDPALQPRLLHDFVAAECPLAGTVQDYEIRRSPAVSTQP